MVLHGGFHGGADCGSFVAGLVVVFVDHGVSFVLVFLFIGFRDTPLLGGVFYRFFWIFSLIHGCMGLPMGAPHLSFVCYYFKTYSLALLVLVKIHCNFNKFHFNFPKKKKKNITHREK